MGSYSTCEEACGISSGPVYTPPARDYAGEAGNALNDQGLAAYRNHDWAAAVSYYQQALQNKPYDTVIQNNLGLAINEQGNEAWHKGDISVAINFYQQAVQNNPDDAVIRQNLDTAMGELAKQQAQERERQARIQQKIAENNALTQNIKSAVDGFSLDNAAPVVKEDLDHAPTAPDLFKTRKAQPNLKFGNPSEDLSEKAQHWFDQVGETIFAKPESAAEVAQINSDPRMVEVDKEITQLKNESDSIDRDIVLLKSQAAAPQFITPERRKNIMDQLDKKTAERQEKVAVIAQKEEVKKKVHHTIEVERGKKQ